MKVEPYNAIKADVIKKRADLVIKNKKFSEKISIILREIAEEKKNGITRRYYSFFFDAKWHEVS